MVKEIIVEIKLSQIAFLLGLCDSSQRSWEDSREVIWEIRSLISSHLEYDVESEIMGREEKETAEVR